MAEIRMPIYVCDIDVARTKAKSIGRWRIDNLEEVIRKRLAIKSLSMPPPVKPNDIRLADEYEQAWRKHAPEVLSSLLDPNDKSTVLFLWAEGPVDPRELLEVFPYIKDYAGDQRYHIESITVLATHFEHHSWACFEFSKQSFVSIMQNQRQDLEYTHLYALACHNDLVPDIIAKEPWDRANPEWAVLHDAIAVSFHAHFEGLYLAGPPERVHPAAERACKNLISQGVEVVTIENPLWWK